LFKRFRHVDIIFAGFKCVVGKQFHIFLQTVNTNVYQTFSGFGRKQIFNVH